VSNLSNGRRFSAEQPLLDICQLKRPVMLFDNPGACASSGVSQLRRHGVGAATLSE
jgi:hypothetical protein